MKKMLFDLYLTLDGRLSRKLYILLSLVVSFATLSLSVLLIDLFGANVGSLGLVTFLLFAYPMFCLNSKRLYDMGFKNDIAKVYLILAFILSLFNYNFYVNGVKSPYLGILLLVIALGSFFFLCYKGEAKKNKHGSVNAKDKKYAKIYKHINKLLFLFFVLYIASYSLFSMRTIEQVKAKTMYDNRISLEY
ncbi:MAG: DUF805 domain-containing protein [Alphaproteobacteria bacterium]|jgi:uncharacterized membrane protein YhaH (DUF805 family)|nr:DUF805 domain-containing protein [Alphaproteobacteria bacterium]